MSFKDFQKALDIANPRTLVSGVVRTVLPNQRGRVELSNGPVLENVVLPDNARLNDSVLLFRSPNDNTWQVVLTGKQDTLGATLSDPASTFVAVPEHIRWFGIYDKVVISWYVWPKFRGVFEVQFATQEDRSDALTWAVTSGGMTVFNPGSLSVISFRIRSINEYYVTSDWTDWRTVNINSLRQESASGGLDGEIAVWQDNEVLGDDRLRWDGNHVYIASQRVNGILSNLSHHGSTITGATLTQEFTLPEDAEITFLRLALSENKTYDILLKLMVNDVEQFASQIPQRAETTLVATGNVSVLPTDTCEIVLEAINTNDNPHMFYTRWESPFNEDETALAAAVYYTVSGTPEYLTLAADRIAFNGDQALEPITDDVVLEVGGSPLLEIGHHDHSGGVMGAEVDALDLVTAETDTDKTLKPDGLGGVEWDSVTFLNLSDTPAAYAGQANRVVAVSPFETGLVFTTGTPPDDPVAAVSYRWFVDGPLAGADETDGVWRAMESFQITAISMYLLDTGSAGSTIVDVERSSDGGQIWTTLYTTPALRPEIPAGQLDRRASTVPDVQQIASGDLLRLRIIQTATSARGLTVQPDIATGADALPEGEEGQILHWEGGAWTPMWPPWTYGRISGKTLRSGFPQSDTVVEIYDADDTLMGSETTATAGEYSITELPPAIYRVEGTYDSGYRLYYCELENIQVLPYGASLGNNLNLSSITGIITGVVYLTGDPEADTDIQVFDTNNVLVADAVSGEDGSYVVGYLPPGDYRIEAEKVLSGTTYADTLVDVAVTSDSITSGQDLNLVAV